MEVTTVDADVIETSADVSVVTVTVMVVVVLVNFEEGCTGAVARCSRSTEGEEEEKSGS